MKKEEEVKEEEKEEVSVPVRPDINAMITETYINVKKLMKIAEEG